MNVPENPFESPQEHSDPRFSPSTDPSVEHEPHLVDNEFQSEVQHQARPVSLSSTEDEAVNHSVWDEPGLAADLTGGPPADALTYAKWLSRKMTATSWNRSWAVTCAVALSSGLLALLGSYLSGTYISNSFVHLMIINPLMQETLKVALIVWIVEARPYLFKTAVQILLATTCSGAAFALLENILAVQPWLSWGSTLFRWSYGLVLHAGCSFTAGIGLVQIWRHCMETEQKPQLAKGGAFLIGAIAIHFLCNGFELLASLSAAYLY